MKRELKKLVNKYEDITNGWFNMSIKNSTAEEIKEKWDDLVQCRCEIANMCISILGIKTEEEAKAISESLTRSTLRKCLKGS